ncbi:MAG: cobalamin B12-binding domain-containing protein [Candidatus Lokiarchaeota archaeon]|nr:cobalamin B12-binding domain-containing protein [Candidatus Lokiarchaeota archaeon]
MDLKGEFIKLLEGEDKEKCVNWALDQLGRGLKVADLYANVLAPSLNAIVCLEKTEAMCIWKEHVKTSIVRAIIENAYPFVLKQRDASKHAKNKDLGVLVMCPPEETHEIGARMVADFFTMAGFNTIFVGSSTPSASFLSAIEATKPRYVAISVSNPYHLFKTRRVIAEIKKAAPEGVEIIIGGSALNGRKEVLKELGADKYLSSVDEINGLGGE